MCISGFHDNCVLFSHKIPWHSFRTRLAKWNCLVNCTISNKMPVGSCYLCCANKETMTYVSTVLVGISMCAVEFTKLSFTNYLEEPSRRRSQRIPYRTLNGFMIWHCGCLLCPYLKYWSQRMFTAIQLVSVSCRFCLSGSEHDTVWILLWLQNSRSV